MPVSIDLLPILLTLDQQERIRNVTAAVHLTLLAFAPNGSFKDAASSFRRSVLGRLLPVGKAEPVGWLAPDFSPYAEDDHRHVITDSPRLVCDERGEVITQQRVRP